jgi:hypothetical protein
MASFNIKNMYTNIPTSEMLQTVKATLIHNHNVDKIIDEILNLIKITLNQNYFTYYKQYFIQEEGIAMDAPTSALFS